MLPLNLNKESNYYIINYYQQKGKEAGTIVSAIILDKLFLNDVTALGHVVIHHKLNVYFCNKNIIFEYCLCEPLHIFCIEITWLYLMNTI